MALPPINIPVEFWTALKKALLEALRWIVLAVVAILAEYTLGVASWIAQALSPWFTVNPLVVNGALIVILKSIDKFMHELGKEVQNKALTLGLTRF